MFYKSKWQADKTKRLAYKRLKNAIFFIFLAGLFFLSFWFGFDRQEVKDCKTWQEWAQDYPLYKSSGWQIEQCKAHGIELTK